MELSCLFSITFPLSTSNPFVFYDIPASFPTLQGRPFVFIEIPASFRQKRIPSKAGRLSWAAEQIKRLTPARANGGGQASVPQPPVPSPQSLVFSDIPASFPHF
jgi:hypothetical protein